MLVRCFDAARDRIKRVQKVCNCKMLACDGAAAATAHVKCYK